MKEELKSTQLAKRVVATERQSPRAHACMHAATQPHTHTPMHAHLGTCPPARMHACSPTDYAHVHAYVPSHLCAYTRTPRAHTHAYASTVSHMPTRCIYTRAYALAHLRLRVHMNTHVRAPADPHRAPTRNQFGVIDSSP